MPAGSDLVSVRMLSIDHAVALLSKSERVGGELLDALGRERAPWPWSDDEPVHAGSFVCPNEVVIEAVTPRGERADLERPVAADICAMVMQTADDQRDVVGCVLAAVPAVTDAGGPA